MKTKDFMMDNKKVSRADALIKVIGEFLRARPKDKIGAVRFVFPAVSMESTSFAGSGEPWGFSSSVATRIFTAPRFCSPVNRSTP